MTEEGDQRYKLVYEEARSAITAQERDLDELRARVGTTLATTVLATAFFGAIGIRVHDVGGLQILALVLFVLAALGQLILLVPLSNWHFRMSTPLLISDYVEDDPPATLDQMYRDLALHIWDDYLGNQGRLNWMWWVFTSAVAVLVLEVVCWVMAIVHP